jgi:hypothetical protein
MPKIHEVYSAISPIIPPLLGVFVGAWITSRATLKSSKNALLGIQRQISFQVDTKLSDFRQIWINDLRNCMAEFQSIGMTPGLEAKNERRFYELGTKIGLLMNRNDINFQDLHDIMYHLLDAETLEEKYSCNADFIKLCQDILKREWEVLKFELRKAAATTK